MSQYAKTRIKHKHDTEVNWNQRSNFIPLDGEIIIYDPDDNYNYSRIKIGDGKTKVIDLSFINNNSGDGAPIDAYTKLETNTKLDEKQNISNDLTIVPDNYGAASISLDGKTQYYYLESINPDGNFLNLDIFYDNFEKDEFTFYIYLNLSSETPISFVLSLIKPTEGPMPLTWIEEPTIDYPHTKMLLAFQTTDGGASWIVNQCYSLEVTE